MHNRKPAPKKKLGTFFLIIWVFFFYNFWVQCFADTAHHPQTNVRPAAVVPVLYAPVGVTAAAAAAAGAEPATLASQPETLKNSNNMLSHLPRPKPYQPFQVRRLRNVFRSRERRHFSTASSFQCRHLAPFFDGTRFCFVFFVVL